MNFRITLSWFSNITTFIFTASKFKYYLSNMKPIKNYQSSYLQKITINTIKSIRYIKNNYKTLVFSKLTHETEQKNHTYLNWILIRLKVTKRDFFFVGIKFRPGNILIILIEVYIVILVYYIQYNTCIYINCITKLSCP